MHQLVLFKLIKKIVYITLICIGLFSFSCVRSNPQTSGKWTSTSFQTFGGVDYLTFTLSHINSLLGYDIEYNCSNLDSDTWVFFDSFANRISYRLLIRVDGNDPRLCGNDHAHIFRSKKW